MKSQFGMESPFLRFIFHGGTFLCLALRDCAQYHPELDADRKPSGQAYGILSGILQVVQVGEF